MGIESALSALDVCAAHPPAEYDVVAKVVMVSSVVGMLQELSSISRQVSPQQATMGSMKNARMKDRRAVEVLIFQCFSSQVFRVAMKSSFIKNADLEIRNVARTFIG